MGNTIPGGFFIGANGKPHDANGKEIEVYAPETALTESAEADGAIVPEEAVKLTILPKESPSFVAKKPKAKK